MIEYASVSKVQSGPVWAECLNRKQAMLLLLGALFTQGISD